MLIAENVLQSVGQRAIHASGVDGLDILHNRIANSYYDALIDVNSGGQDGVVAVPPGGSTPQAVAMAIQSRRVRIEGNSLSNIGMSGRSASALLRSLIPPTEAPQIGSNSWRNTDGSLDGTQALQLAPQDPQSSPLYGLHPSGLDALRLGSLWLRDVGGVARQSADTLTGAGSDGSWRSLDSSLTLVTTLVQTVPAASAVTLTGIALAGAQLGDAVLASLGASLQGCLLTANVNPSGGGGYVDLVIDNPGAAAVSFNTTLRLTVIKH